MKALIIGLLDEKRIDRPRLGACASSTSAPLDARRLPEGFQLRRHALTLTLLKEPMQLQPLTRG